MHYRYLGRGTLDGPIHNQIYKKYEKVRLTKRVIDNLTNKYNFTSVVFHHGIYVPQGIIGVFVGRRISMLLIGDHLIEKELYCLVTMIRIIEQFIMMIKIIGLK